MALAEEIIGGYSEARAFAVDFDPSILRPYSLESRVGDIVDLVQSTREDHAWHYDRIKLFQNPPYK